MIQSWEMSHKAISKFDLGVLTVNNFRHSYANIVKLGNCSTHSRPHKSCSFQCLFHNNFKYAKGTKRQNPLILEYFL
jgi:hypothetical protein